jgi:hypothetical protein
VFPVGIIQRNATLHFCDVQFRAEVIGVDACPTKLLGKQSSVVVLPDPVTPIGKIIIDELSNVRSTLITYIPAR